MPPKRGRNWKARTRGKRPGKANDQRTVNPRGERQPNRLSGSVANPILIVRHAPLFGLRTKKRLQYFQRVSLTGSVSAVYSYVLSANGPYDPDITGTGLQPVGFDQIMQFYNHYTVIRSRLRVVFQNTGTVDAHVAISISGSSTPTTDEAVLIANGEMVYTVITPSGIAGSVATLRTSTNAAAFQGIDNVMDDPNMRGDIASNPTEQLYYHCSIWNPASATVPTVILDAYLEYETIFHEPRKSALSLQRRTPGKLSDPSPNESKDDIVRQERELEEDARLASSIERLVLVNTPIGHPQLPEGWVAVRAK